MNDSKEHILKTAFELFLQKSYKEVTMREIVEKTGLSKGAFYHYFKSKEELFLEILDYFFSELMHVSFERYSCDSLQQFCEDYLNDIEQKTQANMPDGKEWNANFYFLIFDAFKILPEFKKRMMAEAEKELDAWKKIIHIAREKGEIKTPMTDDQVARFYIYTNDGIGIRLIMENKMDLLKKEIKSLWDGFYKQLTGQM